MRTRKEIEKELRKLAKELASLKRYEEFSGYHNRIWSAIITLKWILKKE